ncbi:Tubulin FtsZ family GTPase domain [Trypanosoma vivax]|uniref:Tubulin delta chain n=1 Tax=Trypanosoma vivax (strain Y486) TaxID=1055687 RepID=G0UCZ2_TRYVY|nr:putative delta tubulin [Trypanosoma vivax]KAH8607903.1 Tubulin FtsZ family GTPase domain [Trypanosoma vivax]CCC53702.1 putative delta tubulin [Trypanosoma vivax Y486]
MACVHVLVGQCGNQLGANLLQALTDEARDSSDEEYAAQISSLHFRPAPCFRSSGSTSVGAGLNNVNGVSNANNESPLPRSVMIDMEPKVIESVVANVDSVGAFQLHTQQCVTRDEGSGNNWAFGYFAQGSSRSDDIAEALRRESECRGSVRSFHVLHSAAGGTGSGVGCLVSDIVRTDFPRAVILHSVVWPFSTGEVVTQWYNCVLAMSALRDSADGVFILYNDDFNTINSSSLRRTTPSVAPPTCEAGSDKEETGTAPAYIGINNEMSRLLLDLHLPHKLCDVSSPLGEGVARPQKPAYMSKMQPALHVAEALRSSSGLADIVEAVALDPALKFFSGVSLPVTTSIIENRGHTKINNSGPCLWKGLLNDAARVSEDLFPTSRRGNSALSSTTPFPCGGRAYLWSLRGSGAFSEGYTELRNVLGLEAKTPPTPLPTSLMIHEQSLRAYPAHVSVFGLTRHIGTRLAAALERAEQLLRVGAFIHHFNNYSVGKKEMGDAILRMWDTVAAYSDGFGDSGGDDDGGE